MKCKVSDLFCCLPQEGPGHEQLPAAQHCPGEEGAGLPWTDVLPGAAHCYGSEKQLPLGDSFSCRHLLDGRSKGTLQRVQADGKQQP